MALLFSLIIRGWSAAPKTISHASSNARYYLLGLHLTGSKIYKTLSIANIYFTNTSSVIWEWERLIL